VFSARISQDLTKLIVIGKFSNSLRNFVCFVTSKTFDATSCTFLSLKSLFMRSVALVLLMAVAHKRPHLTVQGLPVTFHKKESHILCGLLREASMAHVTDCSVSLYARARVIYFSNLRKTRLWFISLRRTNLSNN
jgi:hypothetical protein